MSQDLAHSTYDELPYPSKPLRQTHPDHLASLATLFDLTPVPADNCRLLELGCASGGNLIPMALAFPGSQFLGVDSSEQQLQNGRKTIAALGLKNVALLHADILDLDASAGRFDYIVCHGVYSWVPEEVRNGILKVIREQLNEHGVGYVSYNTFPGWHMRGTIREMMCYHVSRRKELPPLGRVAEARGLLEFLARSVTNEKDPYSLLLKNELELVQKHSDGYLFHDHLEETNDPLYFFEFNEHLHENKLRYLGEADFNIMLPGNFPANVQEVLTRLAPDLIQMEQYLDFLRNRTFRQSLIVHEHQRANYELHPEKMSAFHLASPMKPRLPNVDLVTNLLEDFVGLHEVTLTVRAPIVKAAFLCLGRVWPRAVPFNDLLKQARQCLETETRTPPRAATPEERLEVSNGLLAAYAGGSNTLMELWLRPPQFAATVSERPLASSLARLQAADGPEVCSLRHQAVTLSEFDRQLLPYLDGHRNRSAMLKALLANFRGGKLTLARGTAPIVEEHRARPILAAALDKRLPALANLALLMA